MNPLFTDRQTVDHLIQDLEDGVITPADHAKLMDLMRSHASVRAHYLKYIEMVALLQESAKSRAELGTIPISEAMVSEQRRRSGMVSFTYGIAALLILSIGFLLFQVSLRPDAEVRGVVMETSDNAKFFLVSADGEPHRSKNLQIGDKITLDHGLARLTFPSGVKAIVEGPTTLKLTSDSSVKMDGGMAWFRVPEAGHGFTVQTDRIDVIDLGTEFGIKFDGQDGLQVHVTKGKVRIEPRLKAMAKVELIAGQAHVFDVYGRGVAVDCMASMFLQKFSRSIPYIHWSFDQLVDGGFEADGTMPKINEYQAKLRHTRRSIGQEDEENCQIKGQFGGSFSMHGKGLFAESGYPGIGGNTPRTVAMWVRHRKTQYPKGVRSPYCAWGLRTRNSPNGKAWKIHLLSSDGGHRLGGSFIGGHSQTKTPFDVSEWTHLTSVFTGRSLENGHPEIHYYVNGIAQQLMFAGIPVIANTDISSPDAKPVRFGASLLSDKKTPLTVDGDLDELYIFRGVLSEPQIQALMLNNSSGHLNGN